MPAQAHQDQAQVLVQQGQVLPARVLALALAWMALEGVPDLAPDLDQGKDRLEMVLALAQALPQESQQSLPREDISEELIRRRSQMP